MVEAMVVALTLTVSSAVLAVDGLAGGAERDGVVAGAGIHGLHRIAGGDVVGAGPNR
jgi:hypothetical protein